MSDQHTIIIGGGIIGVSTAYFLARRGANVTLIDRDAFDCGASTGNAGIIALGHPPMPRPGLVAQSLKMLFDPLNPLYVPPRFDLELWKWMWHFRRACTPQHFEHSMHVLAELGWLAGRCCDDIIDEEQLDCEFSRTGWTEVFRTPQRLEQGLEEAAMLREHGFTAHELSGDELREREPAFLPGVAGAVHYPESRFANPQRMLAELADRAERHGATLMTRTTAAEILLDRKRFSGVRLASGRKIAGDTLVLAGGIWTTDLARSIGVNIPMQPGKGYHMNLAVAPENRPTTVCVLAENYVATTPIGGGLRLAGTVEFSGINYRLVRKRLDMLRLGARQFLHGIDEAPTTSVWCGLRPCTADGLPVIGWAPGIENAFIATGHAMMGFALGPITGRLASECILDGEASFDLTPLSPDRYLPRHRRRMSRAAATGVAAAST